ncbi:protein SHQ1 homolog [Mya arenaria]|uniref:protein SHQ1 homolog n=1 Tax=Mya arenaria TaxID=6604 RepID=UPI0022E41FEA|nr:protein SHQ1 homolog [Mya arenaria]XP_052780125.1 protein SHQ1 homolog [Mya arenaria]
MLTPAFSLEQDKTFLTIIIKAPFAKISETEVFVEENDFKFFSKPYFLRLTLPGNLIEDGREKADYKSDTGEFHITFPKETPGQEFEGLDMITKLLAPKGKTSAEGPLIQVVDEAESNQAQPLEDEEFDWRIEQQPYVEPVSPLSAPKYGFANQKFGVFARLQEDLVGIVDCPDPDKHTLAERRERRLKAETEKFDEDHYIGDLYEDSIIVMLLQYQPDWSEEMEVVSKSTPVELAVTFTDDEKEVMRKLPKKEYLLESGEETAVYLGLVDIMFAYVYNHRTTEGENQCESGWTVSKLSSTLSWLEVFTNLQDVLVSSYRRALCYPLFRNWKLCTKIQQDLVTIFRLGRRRLLKCLLEIRNILLDQDCRYVLNDLYITDYCVWIQSASSKRLESLADAIEKTVVSKADVDLDLVEVERIAKVALESDSDESDVDKVTGKLSGVSLNNELDESDTTETEDENADSDDITSETDDAITQNDLHRNSERCEAKGSEVKKNTKKLIEEI